MEKTKWNRIDLRYTKWNKHGEKDERSISAPKPINTVTEFVDDTNFASNIPTDGPATVEMVNATKDNFDEDDLVKFQELLLDAEKPFYEGCPDFTKLSVIVKLLNLKGKYGCSDKFFTELLGLLKKMLPVGNEMVEKTYQAKKVMKLIGSGYKKIHVCINNCLLYWKGDKDLTACRTWVDTYDASIKDNFNLRVIMLWIINDYPALSTLCGCPYSGFKGCVVCGKDTNCVRLSASSKQSYVSHRRYLPYNHPFIKQKKAFNGEQEFLLASNPMTREQIYNKKDERLSECSIGSGLVEGKTRVVRYTRIRQNNTTSNRNRPEGCIAKETIMEETIEFFSEYHKSMKTIGIPTDKHETDENDEGKPLSAGKSSEVFAELFQKAHLNRPEGCITKETIMEETIEFFSEYHKSMKTIGIPTDKHETDENDEGKPLSAGKSSEVFAELFQKAHLYVIQNTDELVPYIERHKKVLKTKNPSKRIAFLENENSKSFAKWLRKENNEVSVEAIDLHISKEVATTRQAFYYGVLQEIWVLDYRFRKIPLLKFYWVNHRAGGVKRDTTLGYTLVDLNNLGHKIPPKNYKDTYDEVDEEFSTVIHQHNDNILLRVDRCDLELIVISDSSDDINGPSIPRDDILKKFRMRTPGRCADKWMNGKDYRKDNHHVFCIYNVGQMVCLNLSDDSKGVSSKGPSITSIPKEGPSIARLSKEPIPKELLSWYGYTLLRIIYQLQRSPF
nr:hypothetical protein [Tanacetum cinerariifolium]